MEQISLIIKVQSRIRGYLAKKKFKETKKIKMGLQNIGFTEDGSINYDNPVVM